ncbi:MAG: acyl-CoA dehydrogenase family protein [Pirellulaceae bacterium]
MSEISQFDLEELEQLSRDLGSLNDNQPENAWPAEQLKCCQVAGLFRWFSSKSNGGLGWSDPELLRAYVAIAKGCLKTAFVLTQRTAAVSRLERSDKEALKSEWLPNAVNGHTFSTVGISHLTTSRQHLAKPVLVAAEEGDDFILNGYSPWVTGADHADWLVVGASLDDERQILTLVPTNLDGVHVNAFQELTALTGSHTGAVSFENVSVPNTLLLAGPIENVMSQGLGGRTGGLQTSALALGLASSALGFINDQMQNRPDLERVYSQLQSDWDQLVEQMMDLAAPEHAASKTDSRFSNESLRRDANELVLATTHVALAAAKGRGYMADHPVSRWCREALFFLVWSCPQKVIDANVCKFAGIHD